MALRSFWAFPLGITTSGAGTWPLLDETSPEPPFTEGLSEPVPAEASPGWEGELPFQPPSPWVSLPLLSLTLCQCQLETLVQAPWGTSLKMTGGFLSARRQGALLSQPTPGMKTRWQEGLFAVSGPHSARTRVSAPFGEGRAGRSQVCGPQGPASPPLGRAEAGTGLRNRRPGCVEPDRR